MSLSLAVWVVRLVYIYVALVVLLVPWWHWRGLRRLDTTAAHGPWGFRILITPGLVGLWPWLLMRVRNTAGEPKPERNAHRALAGMKIRS
jgi:hypothetical protein